MASAGVELFLELMLLLFRLGGIDVFFLFPEQIGCDQVRC